MRTSDNAARCESKDSAYVYDITELWEFAFGMNLN